MKIISSCSCFLFIFFLIISCNEESHKKQDEPVSEKILLPDSNLNRLKPFFNKDSIKLAEEKPEIPFDLLRPFYKGDDSLNEEYRGPITPVNWFENKYGYFLIIEIGCGAGGYCSTFDLLVFSKGGLFIGREFLGQDAGDLSFSKNFSYKYLSDTTLLINNTTYETHDENSNSSEDTLQKDKLIDSVTYNVLLDTSHYSINYWQKP